MRHPLVTVRSVAAYFLGGPTRSQVCPGLLVGGRGVSRGSMFTFRGCGTSPPRGPRSMCTPGLFGFSPGFCIMLRCSFAQRALVG